MRLIDADALRQSLGITNMDCDKCAWHDDGAWMGCKRGGDFEDACCAIEDAPTIEERKTGEWVIDKGLYKCTSCGELWLHWWAVIVPTERMYKMMRFCPNCGAYMRGEQDE